MAVTVCILQTDLIQQIQGNVPSLLRCTRLHKLEITLEHHPHPETQYRDIILTRVQQRIVDELNRRGDLKTRRSGETVESLHRCLAVGDATRFGLVQTNPG